MVAQREHPPPNFHCTPHVRWQRLFYIHLYYRFLCHRGGAGGIHLNYIIFPFFPLGYWLYVAFLGCDGWVVKTLDLNSNGSSCTGLRRAHIDNRWNKPFYTYRCASFRSLRLSWQTFVHSHSYFRSERYFAFICFLSVSRYCSALCLGGSTFLLLPCQWGVLGWFSGKHTTFYFLVHLFQ